MGEDVCLLDLQNVPESLKSLRKPTKRSTANLTCGRTRSSSPSSATTATMRRSPASRPTCPARFSGGTSWPCTLSPTPPSGWAACIVRRGGQPAPMPAPSVTSATIASSIATCSSCTLRESTACTSSPTHPPPFPSRHCIVTTVGRRTTNGKAFALTASQRTAESRQFDWSSPMASDSAMTADCRQRAESLFFHWAQHHSPLRLTIAWRKGSTLRCDQCPRQFAKKLKLTKHLARMHYL